MPSLAVHFTAPLLICSLQLLVLTLHTSHPPSPLSVPPSSLPPSLPPSLSLRHGQDRISRQSQAVQTQLYDRKNSQPWERNFPSELTHTHTHANTRMPAYMHTQFWHTLWKTMLFSDIQCFHLSPEIIRHCCR